MPNSLELATPLSGENNELTILRPEAAKKDVKIGADIASFAVAENRADGINLFGKNIEENDCALVQSFTPGNRQFDIEPPPDGGIQAWLQGNTACVNLSLRYALKLTNTQC
jgi:hypothetical protein